MLKKLLVLFILMALSLFADDKILFMDGRIEIVDIIESTDSVVTYTNSEDGDEPPLRKTSSNNIYMVFREDTSEIFYNDSGPFSESAIKRARGANEGFSFTLCNVASVSFKAATLIGPKFKLGFHKNDLYFGAKLQGSFLAGMMAGIGVEVVRTIYNGRYTTLALGGTAGYWTDGQDTHEAPRNDGHYFAGPQFNIRIGGYHFYFVIENSLLIGNSLLNDCSIGFEVIF